MGNQFKGMVVGNSKAVQLGAAQLNIDLTTGSAVETLFLNFLYNASLITLNKPLALEILPGGKIAIFRYALRGQTSDYNKSASTIQTLGNVAITIDIDKKKVYNFEVERELLAQYYETSI